MKLANKSGRPKTLQMYFSNWWSLLREPSIHSGMPEPRRCRRRASSRSPQHRLYLLPLPQWHASLRPMCGGRTTSLTLSEASWFRVRPMVSQNVPGAGLAAGRSFLLGLLLHGLSTPQRQQLGIGGENLGNSVFELASLLHQRPDLLHPFIGNTLDALAAIVSEGQRPNGMPFSIGAPTVGFPASPVRESERARQSVWRDSEVPKQGVLALAQTRGGIAFGVVPIHLSVV